MTHDIDTVVHFAAESHNSLAVLDPGRFFRTNVLGTQTMLEAARHAGVARFHHISTCEVYGDLALDSDDAFTEDAPVPAPHPVQRLEGGRRPRRAGLRRDLRAARHHHQLLNNYGPYQFPEKVIPLFSAHALDDRPLPLYESTRNQREWLHVIDHCRAIEAVLERGRIGETYHVGSGVEASIEEIADAVLRRSGKPPVPQEDRPRPPRPRPALPPRLHQDHQGARLGPHHRLRGGAGGHGAVVRRTTGPGGSRSWTAHRWSSPRGATPPRTRPPRDSAWERAP